MDIFFKVCDLLSHVVDAATRWDLYYVRSLDLIWRDLIYFSFELSALAAFCVYTLSASSNLIWVFGSLFPL